MHAHGPRGDLVARILIHTLARLWVFLIGAAELTQVMGDEKRFVSAVDPEPLDLNAAILSVRIKVRLDEMWIQERLLNRGCHCRP